MAPSRPGTVAVHFPVTSAAIARPAISIDKASAFNFKAAGDKLSGTNSGFGGQGDIEISDGKVDGDNISWKTKVEFNGNSMTMTYSAKVSGDEMKVKQTREGSDQVREYSAKRAK